MGGGQLAKMIAVAAAQLGYRCHVYSNDKQSPAFQASTNDERDDMDADKRRDGVDVVEVDNDDHEQSL